MDKSSMNEKIKNLVRNHPKALVNIARREMIRDSVDNREAMVSESGALATWTPPESTGRSPKDTVVVKRAESQDKIDWSSPNNIPITEETFDMLFEDALAILSKKERIYETDRVSGADSSYALPVKMVCDKALFSLFVDNMFRPIPKDINKSIFYQNGFQLLALPYDKLESKKYEGRLRKMPDGSTSEDRKSVV